MSKTQNDPWGGVTRVDITTNQHGYEEYEWRGGYYYRADEVDRARAADRAAIERLREAAHRALRRIVQIPNGNNVGLAYEAADILSAAIVAVEGGTDGE